MTGPADTNSFPPPEPERVERALRAMRARRAKLRRLRIAAASGALVVLVAVAILAVGVSPAGKPRLRVAGPPSSTTGDGPTSTTEPATLPTATAAATTPTTTLPAGTQEITYQPFTATGAFVAGLHVTTRETGTCQSGDAPRTYRCFGTGTPAGVYDPCFAGPNGPTDPLVCPLNPATGDVVEFTATSALPSAPVTATRPWAMQLSGGTVCMFVSAAWGNHGPYGCESGNSAALPADCRSPQSSTPWWTTECQDQLTETSPFTPQRVTKIWF